MKFTLLVLEIALVSMLRPRWLMEGSITAFEISRDSNVDEVHMSMDVIVCSSKPEK